MVLCHPEPWAFSKGLPYKTISSLELLGTAYALAGFGERRLPRNHGDGLVTVTGFTDSAVASNVLVRGMSTSFPLCVVAMEVAMRLERLGARLNLEWVPRELNKEADALSNGEFGAFSPECRIDPVAGTKWLVLSDLMAAGTAFHESAATRRAARGKGGGAPPSGLPTRGRKRDALRLREPW